MVGDCLSLTFLSLPIDHALWHLAFISGIAQRVLKAPDISGILPIAAVFHYLLLSQAEAMVVVTWKQGTWSIVSASSSTNTIHEITAFRQLEPNIGLEPMTYALQVRRSAN